jgi:hypothetical protein
MEGGIHTQKQKNPQCVEHELRVNVVEQDALQRVCLCLWGINTSKWNSERGTHCVHRERQDSGESQPCMPCRDSLYDGDITQTDCSTGKAKGSDYRTKVFCSPCTMQASRSTRYAKLGRQISG